MKEIVDSLLSFHSEEIVNDWIFPVALVAGSLLLGLIFERVVLRYLRKLAEHTLWQGDDIIIAGLKGVTTLWFVLAGAFAASYSLHLSPNALLVVHKSLTVLVILSGTIVLARIVVGLVNLSTMGEHGALPSASILSNIARLSVFLIGILIILQSLGISVTPILTALGVGGLAVALALQDTLSNLFAGLHIIASRKIRPGDYIALETGQEGFVTDVSWRNSLIRTQANNMVIVPNAKLSSSTVTNFSQPSKDLAITLQLAVSYESDLDAVERITIDVASEVMAELPGGVPDSPPVVRFHTFSESGISFSLAIRVQQFTDQYLVRHELLKRLHQQYLGAGIRMPHSVRTIYMRDER